MLSRTTSLSTLRWTSNLPPEVLFCDWEAFWSLEDALKPVQEKLASLHLELLNVDTVVLFSTLTEEMCLCRKLPGSLVDLVIIERWTSPVLESLKARAARAVNHDVRLSNMIVSLLACHLGDLDDLLAVTF
ncbi:hypothetical protein DL766_003679 [Monosporascus sp. MC13-8B]|uniref:Uncharacterized protein n=1 Tax=Monosporascus cannonballus TaxID=155416 RepID=A0ABY0HF71_9PEZI|nr:hypothetical protein DL762_001862 [Monosporascus cannonballus]RYO98292.1 hypothetical protein DL763_002303 [Monosporascus cannonballus]RYP33047.1 hypothetical protein DL766_003679 [Monosporascus sp. MC13-8B]